MNKMNFPSIFKSFISQWFNTFLIILGHLFSGINQWLLLKNKSNLTVFSFFETNYEPIVKNQTQKVNGPRKQLLQLYETNSQLEIQGLLKDVSPA